MNDFTYVSVTTGGQALAERKTQGATYLAGGTNLLDHLKLGVEMPERLVDINKLDGFDKIEAVPAGGLKIGATVRNTTLAYDDRVIKNYRALSEAILAGASPQLRNVATTAGNLLQRTRCYYFRDGYSPCNKREPGTGCSAIAGVNRIHALLGTSEKCIATHPSDLDVALIAFEAIIHTQTVEGQTRTIPIADFYVPYGEDPAKENTLQPGELITAVELPATPWFAKSSYLKARDRASYEFALSSAAVALKMDGETIADSRVALGGVATKPWRSMEAEAVLKGAKADDDTFRKAADAALKDAKPQKDNAFKIDLCKRVILKTLQQTAKLT